MELQSYITPLRKWWWLIAISTLLAAGASYMATRQQVLMYESRATILIGSAITDPNPTNMQFTLAQQLASAYADIARRAPTRQATLEALGLTELPEYTVQALPNTQLLEVVVLDTDPQRSYAVANELTNQILGLSPSVVQPDELERQQFVNEQLNTLETQIVATESDIEAKQEELGAAISAQQIGDIQNQLSALQAKLTNLQSTYADLRSTTQQDAINALTVIEPARIPQQPQNPNTAVAIMAAAAIGFTVAVAAAYLLEYLDDRVKTADYIKQTFQLPILAGINTIKAKEAKDGLITIRNPRSPTAEAFRSLRTNLQFANLTEQNKNANVILIASSNPGEGKSLVAANLSIILAQGGHSVLLIDADLHRPKQATIFGLSQEKGLSTLLQTSNQSNQSNYQAWKGTNYGSINVDSDIYKTHDTFIPAAPKTRLSVLTSGPIPPIPSEMLGSTQMQNLLSRWSTRFDYVILDSPPLLAVSDAAVLSTMVGAVVFVINMRRTRRKQLDRAIQHLRDVNAPLAGFVLNKLKPREEGYTYYSYPALKTQSEPMPSDEDLVAQPAKNGQERHEKQRAFSNLLNRPVYNLSSIRGAGTDEEELRPQEEV